jgi:hypothetical protein
MLSAAYPSLPAAAPAHRAVRQRALKRLGLTAIVYGVAALFVGAALLQGALPVWVGAMQIGYADRALYQAKAAGRGRTILAEPGDVNAVSEVAVS